MVAHSPPAAAEKVKNESLSDRVVPVLFLGNMNFLAFGNYGRTLLGQQHGAKPKGLSKNLQLLKQLQPCYC